MSGPALSSETIHASCVVLDAGAVLLAGRSGAGKSDLALRLIDRGARLVSDDYTLIRRIAGRLVASAPPTIAGKIEVRGIGIVTMRHIAEAEVKLLVLLDADAVRMPEPTVRRLAGLDVPLIALAPLEASAPIKVELALTRLG